MRREDGVSGARRLSAFHVSSWADELCCGLVVNI